MAPSPPDINTANEDEGQQRQSRDESEIRVEFAVNINKQDDLAKIERALESQQGVKLLSSDLESKTILLRLGGQNNETNGNSSEQVKDVRSLQRFVEKQTGFETVVKGLGNLFSAVAELRPPTPNSTSSPTSSEQVIGVVRLSQLANKQCFVDGAIDGLELTSKQRRQWSVTVHEYGDLGGNEFEYIGKPMVELDCAPVTPVNKEEGNLYHKMAFRKVIPSCDVANMIGRSVAVTERFDSGPETNSGKILSGGVIARASTIDTNKKQFCSCSGKTIWQERTERQQGEQD